MSKHVTERHRRGEAGMSWSCLFRKSRVRRLRSVLSGVLILGLSIASWQCKAEAPPSSLAQDVVYLTTMLEAVHPNAYHAYPKAAFYQARDQLRGQACCRSRLEAWKQVMPLLHRLRDGHTFARRPDPELVQLISLPAVRLFPVTVKINAAGQLRVAQNFQGRLRQGDEILSINQQSTQDLLRHLQGFVSGELPSFWYAQLAEDFGTYLWLSEGSAATYELTLRRGAQRFTETISGLSLAALKESWGPPSPSPPAEASPYTFTRLERQIGLLRIAHFSDLPKFQAFLARTMAQIRTHHIQTLIIDLRGNGGGNSALGNALMAYLSPKPFRQYAEIHVKVSAPIKAYYGCGGAPAAPGLTCWSELRDAPIGSVLKSQVPFQSPSPQRFQGQVAVLIDAATFSSAADFAAMVQDFQAGVLIGQETGGLASSYGDVYSFTLPQTKLEIGVSHKYFIRPSGEINTAGVQPDIPVSLIASPRSAQDEQLNAAKQLLLRPSKLAS